jgi:putative transposase
MNRFVFVNLKNRQPTVVAGDRLAVDQARPQLERGDEWTAVQVGFPKAIRVDQGTEFVSRDLDLWAYQRGVTLDFSRPGKPTDNAFIESFNGKFRAECLNAHWFMSLDDARRKCEAWRRDYNHASQHPSVDVIEEKRLC